MNRPGILLDAGPIVALLSRHDVNHERAREVFAASAPPFRTCEAVLAEACFLMRRIAPEGPAEVLALGRKGVYEIAIGVAAHGAALEALLRKYADRPISLADACLIRAAESHDEPRVFTFDAAFRVYRWARHRKFELM